MIAEIRKTLSEEARAFLFVEFEDLKEELIEKHIELGMEASGNWINSLDIIQSEMKTSLLGEKYTEQLVYGRRPGTMPPVQKLRQWLIDKGIAQRLRSEQEISSMAWAIATKIKNEGTKYFREGGTDLVSSVITPERIQRIINNVGTKGAISIAPIFTNYFKMN